MWNELRIRPNDSWTIRQVMKQFDSERKILPEGLQALVFNDTLATDYFLNNYKVNLKLFLCIENVR
jgi:hypothetical protein